MLRKCAGLMLLMLLVSTYGCTRVQRGAVIGAAIGAGAGAAIADSNPRHLTDLQGAGIGAAVGGVLGALIADATEERQEMEARGEPGPCAKIVLSNDILFASGSAKLTERGKALLDEVAQTIKAQYPDKAIHVEGNTDTDPIVYSGWRSNWELGAARALAVLHYLQDVHGIEGSHLSATTFSYYRPVDTNDTAEGKHHNRRTAIVIYMMERD